MRHLPIKWPRGSTWLAPESYVQRMPDARACLTARALEKSERGEPVC